MNSDVTLAPNANDKSLRTILERIQGIPADVLRNASQMLNDTINNKEGHGDDPELYNLFDSVRNDNLAANVILALVFSAIVLASLFGNSLVCYIIFCNKRMHTTTNVFITNLAVADLLITCLNIPFNLARYIMIEWIFGNVMCHVIMYVQTICVYSFTFTLCSIALDRHFVIMYPLRPRISMRAAIGVLVLIWLLSAILSTPFALWYGQREVSNNLLVNSVRRCTKLFPDKDVERYVYLCTAITQYFIPLILISFVYARIAQHLWVRVTLGHVTRDQQQTHMKSKRKSIKMLVCVVLAFAITWLPLNIYYLILHFPPPDHSIKHHGSYVFSCYWVAMTSVILNPLIYSFFNEAFRAELVNLFYCCFSYRRQIHPGYEIDGLLVRSDQVRRQRSERTLNSSGPQCKVPFPGTPRRERPEPVIVASSQTGQVGERLTEYSPLSDQPVLNGQIRLDSISENRCRHNHEYDNGKGRSGQEHEHTV